MRVNINKDTISEAKWIWYPFDFEYNLYNNTCAKYYKYRDIVVTPYWRIDSVAHSVEFRRTLYLKKDNVVAVRAEGTFSVIENGLFVKVEGGKFTLKKGV